MNVLKHLEARTDAALDAVVTTVSLHHFAKPAVLAAYGFSVKKDLFAQIPALNQEAATNIENDDPIMPPGMPKHYPDARPRVTEECIKPQAN